MWLSSDTLSTLFSWACLECLPHSCAIFLLVCFQSYYIIIELQLTSYFCPSVSETQLVSSNQQSDVDLADSKCIFVPTDEL